MATTVSLKPNAVEISGSTSGTTTLQATAVAGTTTLTLPAATDTLVGKATTDTLTNKTLTSPTISDVATFAAGTAALPAITTTGDTNTGIFFPAADTIAFSEGGAEAARIDSSGRFIVGSTAATGSNQVEIQTGLTNALWVQTGSTSSSNYIADFRNGSNISALTIFGNATSTFVTTVGVGQATPSTSGSGITFPATQSASTDANTLDDYEEGTWTPVLARSSGGPITATTSDVTAKYTKVGNLVTVSLFLIITGVTSQGTSENEIRGLPFAPTTNALGAGSVGRNDAFTTDVVHNCWVWGDSRIIFSSNVNSASATAVDWKTGYINLTMTYTV